jgi:hypothetical protein
MGMLCSLLRLIPSGGDCWPALLPGSLLSGLSENKARPCPHHSDLGRFVSLAAVRGTCVTLFFIVWMSGAITSISYSSAASLLAMAAACLLRLLVDVFGA